MCLCMYAYMYECMHVVSHESATATNQSAAEVREWRRTSRFCMHSSRTEPMTFQRFQIRCLDTSYALFQNMATHVRLDMCTSAAALAKITIC